MSNIFYYQINTSVQLIKDIKQIVFPFKIILISSFFFDILFKPFLIFIVLGLLIALFEAVAYVWSGMYGDIEKVGYGNALLIVL